MCLHLVVRDGVDQPMSVALGCCTMIKSLAATFSVCVAYVRFGVFHELEIVFDALVLCLRETETLLYSFFVPVESRARSIEFRLNLPLLDACDEKRMRMRYACAVIATDLEPIHPANPVAPVAYKVIFEPV